MEAFPSKLNCRTEINEMHLCEFNICQQVYSVLPFLYRCYRLKKVKLNCIKIENKNKLNQTIGSLRYHDGDGHENVA